MPPRAVGAGLSGPAALTLPPAGGPTALRRLHRRQEPAAAAAGGAEPDAGADLLQPPLRREPDALHPA